IQAAIRKNYAPLSGPHSVKALVATMKPEIAAPENLDKVVTESGSALVRLVNQIIIDAHDRKASDIHIETYPGKSDTKIRFRQDGELTPYLNVPASFRHALTSRIKIMAGLDISERRKPQDGKIAFDGFGPAKIELRVATMPTAGGMEDVVMRVLAAAEPIALDKLGLRKEVFSAVTRIAEMPHGLFLICGPTGSGKTTTLHSVLSYINTPERKIWTAEDPVEITQVGLRQVQVNAKIGLTFAAAMRAFLRLDPDVIMVGEMRDSETAKTGVEASLTGHLVLSTLHTNSAPESVVRLLDLGLDPFNFADALLGLLAQRLARGLCPRCKVARKASEQEIDLLLAEYCAGTQLDRAKVRERWSKTYVDKTGSLTLHEAKGCSYCENKGYRGRVGLHEMLVNSRSVRTLIQEHAKVEEIQKTAMAEGMLTLKQDGIEKILLGLTDIAQVRGVAA
ncbi:MAG: GspE/PulE family protein, partial [Burkholderiales bacterium]